MSSLLAGVVNRSFKDHEGADQFCVGMEGMDGKADAFRARQMANV
jgi:hypothetical protein